MCASRLDSDEDSERELCKVLEELQAQGKLRSIGVSNYVIEDLEELMVRLPTC